MDPNRKSDNVCPVDRANVLSRILFWWLNPLLRLGNKKPLDEGDLYAVTKSDSSKQLCERFEKLWELELRKQKTGKQPSLRAVVFKFIGVRYLLWGLVAVFMETLRVVQPILLGGLISFFRSDSDMELMDGYLYAMGISLCSIIPAVSFHVYTLALCRYGMWLRIGICSLVYKKCLRLSSKALANTSTGQIVNLMSNDAQKLDQSVLFGHFFIIGPVQMVAVGVILWYKIYWAVLAGMGILVLMIPVSGILGKIFARLRSKVASCTDERVRQTNEMLTAMRIVKMYCWEMLFRRLIHNARTRETASILKASYAKAMAMAPFFYLPKLIAYFTFLTYILTGNKLTAETVFVTLSLYTPVRLALTYYLPFGAQVVSEALITVGRMQEFLLKEERKVEELAICDKISKEKEITVSGITASWEQNSSILRDISFSVRQRELLIVIGPVGSGKSSLLMAILGELPLQKGDINISGKIAYVSQLAWVFGSSVRDNILFGEPFDADKYNRVVEAAALKRDFQLMACGDQTLVGDRGVSLSGGQKARISLARALYQDADVYLLDDPLSAVDAHVSNHIFHKCICGHLKNKSRILITHQLQYLKAADKILILSTDSQAQLGTFGELTQHGVDFALLMKRESEETSKESSSNATAKDDVKGKRAHRNGDIVKGNSDLRINKMLITDDSHSPTKRRKQLEESTLLSKSYADVYRPLGDLQGIKPLLSQSMDLKKAFDKDNQRAGTLSSIVSAVSLALQDHVEEYVPQAQEEERRAAGTVNAKLYLQLFKTGGGVMGLILFAFLNVTAQVSFILADWWLAFWCNNIEAYERKLYQYPTTNDTYSNITDFTMATDQPSVSTGSTVTAEPYPPFPYNMKFLHIFTGLTAAVVLLGVFRALHSFHIVVQAAKSLHRQMLDAVLRCPISFFDLNPIGRILNRFAKDLGQVDEVLPFYLYDFVQALLMIIAVFLVVGATNPWIFIAIVPLMIIFALLRRYFLNTIRNVKRLEATTKSPVLSHISSTQLGIHTILSHHAEPMFVRDFYEYQDLHTSAFFLFTALVRWFALRLECICALFITIVAFCAVFTAQSMNGGLVGLSLNYAITLMVMFQWAVRQSSEVESLMTSVERIVEYSSLPPEAPLESTEENKPPSDWPTDGSISGQDVYLKYKEDGANILDNLNFSINSSEKIGIVGRTGAGKSSLIGLLFRLVEPDGKLCIDNIDITKLGLHDLRDKVSIIPQDPVLLTGSVRVNLDPLNIRSDLEIWQALKQVQLQQMVEEMKGGLDSLIQEGGTNLSVGQRQLICLARAILKCNKVLVIDEATANVDPRTDALIQSTIREQFAHCTVLTIAHRLNTIIDSDRIMVLDAGRIIEFDRPYVLLQNTAGHFYKMAEQTGPTEFNCLLQIAEAAFLKPTKQQLLPPKSDTEIRS